MSSVLLAGAVAGLVSDAIVHPIDTIRTIQQTSTRSPAAIAPASNIKTGLVDIIKQNGLLRLYRGFGAVAVGSIPGHALYFYGYEVSKRYFDGNANDSSDGSKTYSWKNTLTHLGCGFFADVCGSLVWTPMEVIKQRLQSSSVQSNTSVVGSNSYKELRRILKTDGFFGLYQGFGAALLTYGPYVSIYFALYEYYKHRMTCIYDTSKEKLPFYLNLTGAALAGTFSAVVTCPLDVVKTRLQVQQTKTHFRYNGISDAFVTIIRQEGVYALFSGVKPRALWMAGGTAITMMVYEELK